MNIKYPMAGMVFAGLILSASAYAADEWYENLESSTIKYSCKNQDVDRKGLEAKLASETSDSRTALNAWGASTQMMIKPSQSG